MPTQPPFRAPLSHGAFAAQQIARSIAIDGSSVTILTEPSFSPAVTQPAETAKAFYLSGERDMRKTLRLDGEIPENIVVVLQFPGAAWGIVNFGDVYQVLGINYRAEQLHPEVETDVVKYVAVACSNV